MQGYVAGDDNILTERVGDLLSQLGHDCPASHRLPLGQAAGVLSTVAHSGPAKEGGTGGTAAAATGGFSSGPEFLIVLLSDDVEQCYQVIRDIRRQTSLFILAVGPATDIKLVLRAIREGASEYVDRADLENEIAGALERLEASLPQQGRVISILAPSGGSGASTLAVNLATLLARNHHECLLVDLRIEAGDLASLLNLKPTYSIADVCQNRDRLDFSLLRGCLVQHESGLQLLAAPSRMADAARVTPEAVQQLLSVAAKFMAFTIVDLGHSLHELQRKVVPQQDLILLAMRLDFTSLRNTRRTLEYLRELQVPPERIRVIANRTGQPGELTLAQAEESVGIKVFHCVPDDPRTVNRAENSGIPVVTQAPSTRVARALNDLMVNLLPLAKTRGQPSAKS